MYIFQALKVLFNHKIWKYIIIGLLIFDFLIPSFNYFFIKKGYKDFENIVNSWKSEFTDKQIQTISIQFNDDFNSIFTLRFDGWKSVKNVYVNNFKCEIDSVYMWSDFFHEKKTKFYSIVDSPICDSIVYKFPPIDMIEIYDKNKKLTKIKKKLLSIQRNI
jgi:hypothetical protein